MTNERYKIMRAAYLAAKRGLGNCLIYILSPSTMGKSDTVQIFLKNHPQSKLLPAATNAALYEEIYGSVTQTGVKIFFLDDRSLWTRNDFNDAIGYMKILAEGKVKPLRKTKFAMEIAEIRCTVAGVLLLNFIQGNNAYPRLQETGFIDRALKIRVNHSEKEYGRILSEYNKHGWRSEDKLPDFYVPEDFFKGEDDPQTIDDDIRLWINDNFKSATRKTVMLIAMVTTRNGFWSLRSILESSLQDSEFMDAGGNN